jgi:hypothetical protein
MYMYFQLLMCSSIYTQYNIYGISVSQMTTPVVYTIRSFPHLWIITGIITRVTRQVSLVEQELLILLENHSSPTVLCGIFVPQSIVFCVMFCRSCLSLFFWTLFMFVFVLLDIVYVCLCSFGHCLCLSLFFWTLFMFVFVLLDIV